MTFPERFSHLPEYAFPRLRSLLDSHAPGGDVLSMSIGEPQHPFPEWVGSVIDAHVAEFGRYPPNDGSEALLHAISGWAARRYRTFLDPDTQIMALNGSREGLFNAMMALCPEQVKGKTARVLIPNPFYQVYAVGTVAAGAEPVFVPATRANGFLPDYSALDADVLNQTAVAFICSPSNPQGVVAEADYLRELILLAEKYDFQIFADECYSEIYEGAEPPSALAVATEMGADPERVVIFNSLSKRSNLPGLRSGFVAGGPQSVARLKRLRSYAGAPLPLPLQRVAERAWSDETHVETNRALYVEKYHAARRIFGDIDGAYVPRAGFFLWLDVGDGEAAALKLWQETGIRVLPGAYLARRVGRDNPGAQYIRVAMVAPKEQLQRGLAQLRDCLYQ